MVWTIYCPVAAAALQYLLTNKVESWPSLAEAPAAKGLNDDDGPEEVGGEGHPPDEGQPGVGVYDEGAAVAPVAPVGPVLAARGARWRQRQQLGGPGGA